MILSTNFVAAFIAIHYHHRCLERLSSIFERIFAFCDCNYVFFSRPFDFKGLIGVNKVVFFVVEFLIVVGELGVYSFGRVIIEKAASLVHFWLS